MAYYWTDAFFSCSKCNVDSPKDTELKYCSKAEVPGIVDLDSRRVSGSGTAKELDLLSPESPGPS